MSEFVFADRGGELRFVGDFDGLYRSELDPWQQSGSSGEMAHYYEASRHTLAASLRALSARGLGLEVGCGHGHAMAYLRRHGPMIAWEGLDISEVAIGRAREIYPDRAFHVADFASPLPQPQERSYDVVLLNQVLWYIIARLDVALANSQSLLKPRGFLVLSQAFLRKPQRYAADIADGFAGTVRTMIDHLPNMRLVMAGYDDDDDLCHSDGFMVFRC